MQNGFRVAAVTSIAVVAALAWLLRAGSTGPEGDTLILYYAAGIRQPVEEVIDEYSEKYDVEIQTQSAGSGRLMATIADLGKGDLFLAADVDYLEQLRAGETFDNRYVEEILPVAYQRPVIAVARGNPKNIQGLDDLVREDVKLSLADPKVAAISKTARSRLTSDTWDALWEHKFATRDTVNMVAGDVKLGAADAGIIWDATATQYPSIDMVAVPEFDAKQNQIAVGVLTSAKDPTRALHFARYLTARDRGLQSFEKHGYRPVEGDKWAEKPEISLYCGGLNWLATEPIVKEFQKREGCQVLTRYGGCGQLVGEMQARVGSHNQLPCDAYFACDVTYMERVQQWFDSPRDVSKVEMVIAVQKGNPEDVKQLSDLARDGMQVGLCNPQLSALGDLTKQLLDRHALYEAVSPNVQDQPATAASLVEQVSLQRLDAAIVYRANTAAEENRVDVVEIDDPNVWAVQPVAVSKNSGHKHLSERLMQRLISADSQPVFEDLKFQWLGETAGP